MRAVQGFLTDDGTFMNTKEEAVLYDALHNLRFVVTNVGANPDKVLILVDGCSDAIKRYINAKEAYRTSEEAVDQGRWAERASDGNDDDNTAERERSIPATPSAVDNTVDARTESIAASLLEQQAYEPEHVPDVGSSVGAETLRHDSALDGSGSGFPYARSVRSDPYLATTSHAALTGPRRGGGATAIRYAKAGKVVP